MRALVQAIKGDGFHGIVLGPRNTPPSPVAERSAHNRNVHAPVCEKMHDLADGLEIAHVDRERRCEASEIVTAWRLP